MKVSTLHLQQGLLSFRRLFCHIQKSCCNSFVYSVSLILYYCVCIIHLFSFKCPSLHAVFWFKGNDIVHPWVRDCSKFVFSVMLTWRSNPSEIQVCNSTTVHSVPATIIFLIPLLEYFCTWSSNLFLQITVNSPGPLFSPFKFHNFPYVMLTYCPPTVAKL